MSEVYWIAGARLSPADSFYPLRADGFNEHPAVAAVLQAAGARRDWVDQFFWIRGEGKASSDCEAINRGRTGLSGALLSWPRQTIAPHYLFHAASRSIMVGDTGVVVIAHDQPTGSTAVMLAGPGAVGRYNLLPRARIAARREVGLGGREGDSLAGQIYDSLTEVIPDPCGVQLIALPGWSPQKADPFLKIFPHARMLPDESLEGGDIFFCLNKLIETLEKDGLENGLLISCGGPDLTLVSSVERV